ncbi:MAG: FAD-dependent oxidoreductase, partial [Clostridia bacterium]|nr:FAD-dependent oxidoreductase [Clostridia bacterium]
FVVNCAGIYSGKVAELIGDNSIEIVFRKGEYMLLDKNMGYLPNTVIFQCPSEMGKGILVTDTVDGNLITGPSSIDIGSVDADLSTNADVLDAVIDAARLSVPEINTRNVITSFAGLRAHSPTNDFIIGESEVNPSFINVAGIESPGLSAAPAIGIYVKDLIVEKLGAQIKENYEPSRKAPVRFNEMTNEQKKELIEKDKRYGRIICRCETVTEGEILDAIHSPIPATDVDGVKRRTRAGMGRCQGGFCGSKVVELLAREHGLNLDDITKFGGNSKLLVGKTK